MTEDQLTKKILMQDQIANIENRLEELRKPININDNSDDDTKWSGGGGGVDDGTPPRQPGRDEFDELTRRLNRLRGNHPPLPPPRMPRTLRVPRPDVDPIIDLIDSDMVQ